LKDDLFGTNEESENKVKKMQAKIMKNANDDMKDSLKELDVHLANKSSATIKTKSVSDLKVSEVSDEESSDSNAVGQEEADRLDKEIDNYFAP
jgi:hypothetical protein